MAGCSSSLEGFVDAVAASSRHRAVGASDLRVWANAQLRILTGCREASFNCMASALYLMGAVRCPPACPLCHTPTPNFSTQLKVNADCGCGFIDWG